MIYPIYAIQDVKTGFLSPMVDQNDLSAKRNFAYAVNGNNQIMNFAPQDYRFYKIGEYDSEKGEIKGISPIVFICDGVEVYEK